MFVWEVVEELIENLIAVGCAFLLSEIFTLFIVKAFSTLVIIFGAKGIKVCIKRFLVPVVKTLTYKEGFDKMSKIKQFFTWIWANKKTLLGTVSTAVAGLSATEVIPANALPAILVKGFNITPILYYSVLAVLSLLGVFGVGIEKIEEFFNRKALIKAEKEQKAIEKEAKKEIKVAEKLANQTQAEQEKANAKKVALEKAKAEKEKIEKEHRAKVEQAKAKLLAEQKK